ELTLFSTENLHIFQTYYGGLRPTADGSSWEYGDVELVSQMVHDGQDIKPWLMGMSEPAEFIEDQLTLIGALWYRENDFVRPKAQWETYFMPMMSAVKEGNEKNEVMLRTTAKELIVEDGKVTGVKAEQYDGTEVTAHATKGVVLATGGFAANIAQVVDTNEYWSSEFLSTSTKTTNRSSLKGDGITMGEAAGADVTGMNFTQLMPISWIDNGNLAFGGGNYAVYINPTTGERFVNETAERDVLSLAEFNNGIERQGSKGVFIEIANAKNPIPGPYPYGSPTAAEGSYGAEMWMTDVEDRQYLRKVSELPELFKELNLETDGEKVIETLRTYDDALINNPEIMLDAEKFGQVIKRNPSTPIGDIEKDDSGNYKKDTYNLEDTVVRVRLMAPSTHHTMGGLKVDLDRHVLDKDGNVIPGLYAAGEVTGGIHGGNRLGGNAIVEIIVSGRAAANGIQKDNQ
ncbi:MAG: FAD-binding protein, partial [Solobacterium sp.]|nr:FAD-binding protein [Solobacterium sp.]